MNEQLSPDKILQTGLAFWASKTLLSAIELGLFTELSRSPERLDSISAHLGLHPRSARDFLDALVALEPEHAHRNIRRLRVVKGSGVFSA